MNAAIFSLAFDLAGRLVPLGALWLVQSTLLIGAGLLIAQLGRRLGPALESAVLRTTLIAALLCPVLSLALGRFGIEGGKLPLPPGADGLTAVTPRANATTTQPATSSAAPSTSAPPAATHAVGTAAVAPLAQTELPGAQTVATPLDSSARREFQPALRAGTFYALATVIWVIGGAFMLLRLAICHGRIARLRREADLADVIVFENCGAIARALAIDPPEVRVHTGIRSPLLVGLFRPAILLPDVKGLEDLVATREVLVHELAHAERGDCFWHLLSRIATALLWIQPLLWLLARRIEEAAEDVCDNYVIEHARDRRAYAEKLVALAEQLQFSPTESLAGTGVIAFRSALGQRVVRILDASRNLSLRVRGRALAGTTAVLALVTAAASLVGVTDARGAKGEVKLAGPLSIANVKTLLSTKGGETAGVLSPDETLLAFIDWTPGKAGLTVKDVRTGEAHILVPFNEETDEAVHPVWSPDSQSIAYHSIIHPYAEVLRIVSRNGGLPKTLSARGFFAGDWSRDGKFLLGSIGMSGQERLGILEVATGEIRVLASFWPAAEHARFSPDGKFIVFERFVDGNRDVYVTSVDGGKTTRITDSPAEDGTPVFSADGKFVLFSSNRRAGWDLWGVAIENGQPVGSPWPIKYGFGDVAKWTTASGKLAFRIGTSGIGGDLISADVYTVDAPRATKPSGAPRPLAKTGFGRNYVPAWSPDGTRVAYVRMRGVGAYQSALCVQSLADGREELFETGMAKIIRIYWAPDGSQVALAGSGPGGGYGIFLFSFVTRKLAANPLKGALAGNGIGFSADGNAYIFTDSKLKQRMAINLATGESRPISAAQDQARIAANIAAAQHNAATEYCASADESVIAFVETVDAEQRLVVADGSYNNQRIIARAPKPKGTDTVFRWLRLSPDKQKLAYFDRPTGSPPAQFHVAATDGSWNQVVETGTKQCIYAPTWSADSAKLAVTLTEELAGEIGVLENFLPPEKLAAK